MLGSILTTDLQIPKTHPWGGGGFCAVEIKESKDKTKPCFEVSLNLC